VNGQNHFAPLSDQQAGHLRHFANLSRQPPNDWSLMQGRGTAQDDFGGYRFQLAYMAYALALTHRHRLPAAPGLFKPVFDRLIEKMLLPEVWMYWSRISRGGSVFNAHLSHTYKEEWDPVGRDNIMYSAYVQSMTLLYNYLFDDNRFTAPAALTFKYWSYFWGGEERRFEYDQNSLNQHVYWLMAESGFLGVACEPNCVFQICNQPAILGFRLNDLLTGETVAQDVTAAYQKAWEQFGRVGDNGHYHLMVSQDSKTVRPNVMKTPWADAWCGTLMNMWNREFVREHYPAQIRDWLETESDGTISVRSAPPPVVMGHKVINDSSDFGWAAAWASEMGDEQTLAGLSAHAQRYLSPTWRDGGYYFPRNDVEQDPQGHRTLMAPMTGNVLLGYASLNVPDGLWGLYNLPWSPAQHTNPALVIVDDGVDVLQAYFDGAAGALHFVLQVCSAGRRVATNVVVGRLQGHGSWQLTSSERLVARGSENRLEFVAHGMDIRASEAGIVIAGAPQAVSFVMQFASN
jgi:Linalool dehydratase/isomerase